MKYLILILWITKVTLNKVDFDLTENPIKVLATTSSAKNLFLNLVSLRFECFKNFIITKRMIPFLFLFILKYTYKNLTFNSIYIYNLILLDSSNSYKVFRHLFNLPVNGQRTWGGGGSIRIMKSQLYKFKVKKMLSTYGIGPTLYMAEIVNMLWHYQWHHEWIVSYNYLEELPWYVTKKKKYVGITMMVNRKIESFFKHPYRFKKKKHHRKKHVVNKHVISTGFEIGFTRKYKPNLFS